MLRAPLRLLWWIGEALALGSHPHSHGFVSH